MSETRYIYRVDKLTEAEAILLRNDDIVCTRQRIYSLLEELKGSEQELQELLNSPLPTSVTIQVELNPGDEGYEEAPVRFNPALYTGSIKWKEIP